MPDRGDWSILEPRELHWIQQLARVMPFYRHMGIMLVRLGRGRSELRLKITRSLTQDFGVAHGGVAASLIDSAVGLALCTLIKPEQMISTIEMNVNYLTPAHIGIMKATGRIIHKGKRIAVGESLVFEQNKIVAKGLVTYMILEGKRRRSLNR